MALRSERLPQSSIERGLNGGSAPVKPAGGGSFISAPSLFFRLQQSANFPPGCVFYAPSNLGHELFCRPSIARSHVHRIDTAAKSKQIFVMTKVTIVWPTGLKFWTAAPIIVLEGFITVESLNIITG
jgi:hypothetical protein